MFNYMIKIFDVKMSRHYIQAQNMHKLLYMYDFVNISTLYISTVYSGILKMRLLSVPMCSKIIV